MVRRMALRGTFDEAPELYDRVRPGYPEEAVEDLATLARLRPGSRVLEIGCGTGQATVVVSRQRGQAVFLASGLPPAPAARTYQLWVVGGSGPRPAGLVEVVGSGSVTRLLDGPVTGDEQVAMTVERRGGAARPTSKPVVVVDLKA